MSTKPSGEVRHRWTAEERARLVEESKRYATVAEAADALYVSFGQPRQAVYAQMYELFVKGRAPHLALTVEREATMELSASVMRAVRELARAMRVDGISDALVSVEETIKVQVIRRSKTIDIEFL
jgi:transposase-like protein